MVVIDPGAGGGIVHGHDGLLLGAIPMPKTDRDVCDALAPRVDPYTQETELHPVAYLEDLVKYTGRNMPSSAMAIYAGNWGFIRGVLTTQRFRIVLVPPKAWQKALGLGGAKSHPSKTAWKNHLKQRAEQLFPKIKVTLATADALLIFEAARRGLLG